MVYQQCLFIWVDQIKPGDLGQVLGKENHFLFQSIFASSCCKYFFLREVPNPVVQIRPSRPTTLGLLLAPLASFCLGCGSLLCVPPYVFGFFVFLGGWAGVSCEMGEKQERVHLHFSCMTTTVPVA